MSAAAVRIIAVPVGLPEGWDAADAAAEGWTPDQARAWLRANVRTVEQVASCNVPAPAPPPHPAEEDDARSNPEQRMAVARRTNTRPALTGPLGEDPPALGDREPTTNRQEREIDHYIDPKNPRDTAQRFLAVAADRDGLPELVRWQAAYWRALGTRYEPRAEEEVAADLYRFLDGKWDADSNRPIKPARHLVLNTEHALRAAALLSAREAPAWIGTATPRQPAEEIVAFRNGLLHLPTRRWTQPTRAFFGLNAVAFDYEPCAPEPRIWLNFLAQLWPDDGESIETLQEIFGLALTGDTSFQKLFLMIGPKRSGKGTIARVLTAMVGLENVSAPSLSGLGQHFGLQGLIGKTLAVISDARLGGRVDLFPVVENLLRISGEDTLSVPRKNLTDWTAKLRVRFVIISNELPNFTDQSGALASRFVVLRLMRSFYGEEDRGLSDRLIRELPGIVLWSLEGLERLRARGYFRQPASALEMVRQLESLASPINAFIAERCVLAPAARVNCAALFEAWQDWCREQGRDHAGTSAVFSRNLSAARAEIRTVQRRATDGTRPRFYEGIGLRAPQSPADAEESPRASKTRSVRRCARRSAPPFVKSSAPPSPSRGLRQRRLRSSRWRKLPSEPEV